MKLLVPFAACGLIFGSLVAAHGGPCSYSLSPASASFSSAAGAGAFNVTAGSTCSWTATTTNSWIHTTGTGMGNGTVNYTVDANGGASQRVGAITISKQTFTINQAVSLGVALDNTNLIWVTGADYPWYSATDVTYDGVDAAASGNQYIADSTSWLQTSVVGPGTLSFWWKVNTDPSVDLEFYIAGALQDQINGSDDWSYRTYAIPAGTNVLQWQFVKVGSVNSGTDRGWLDQVI